MQTQLKTILFALATGLVLSSCEGDDLSGGLLEREVEIANRYLQVEASISNTYQMIDKVLRDSVFRATDSSIVDFAIVTRNGSNILIDFGNGVISPDGYVRQGSISILENGDYRTYGGFASANFTNYTLNQFNVQGSMQVTNYLPDSMLLGLNDFLTMDSIEMDGIKSIKWGAGFNTSDVSDDRYSISGTASGTLDDGSLFSVVTDPLQFDNTCEHRITTGMLDFELQLDTVNATGTLDFIDSDGCQNLAKVSVERGDQSFQTARQFFGF